MGFSSESRSSGLRNCLVKGKLVLIPIICRAVCRWEVGHYKDYRVYQSGLIPGEQPRCTLLLQVDGSGHAGEGFRLSLEGDRLEADIWTSDIFPSADLAGFRLRYEVATTSVEIRPNTLSSRWDDVHALPGKGTLVAFRPDAAEDCSAEFKQLYAEAVTADPSLGAAIRWNIQAKSTSELRLVLQCLPASADRLRAEPRLSADDCQAIQIEVVDLDTEWLNGDEGPGPVPVLFSRNPEETREFLASHPDRIKPGTCRVQRRGAKGVKRRELERRL